MALPNEHFQLRAANSHQRKFRREQKNRSRRIRPATPSILRAVEEKKVHVSRVGRFQVSVICNDEFLNHNDERMPKPKYQMTEDDGHWTFGIRVFISHYGLGN